MEPLAARNDVQAGIHPQSASFEPRCVVAYPNSTRDGLWFSNPSAPSVHRPTTRVLRLWAGPRLALMGDSCAAIRTKVIGLEALENGYFWPERASEACVLIQRACRNPLSSSVLLSYTSCDIYFGPTIPSHIHSSMYLCTDSH